MRRRRPEHLVTVSYSGDAYLNLDDSAAFEAEFARLVPGVDEVGGGFWFQGHQRDLTFAARSRRAARRAVMKFCEHLERHDIYDYSVGWERMI